MTFSASRELEAVVARGLAVAVGGMLTSAGDTSYLTSLRTLERRYSAV